MAGTDATRSGAYYSDPNGVPRDGEGKVTHLGVNDSEIAPRIVTVGSLSRAHALLELLDEPAAASVRTSSRGFTTYTGRFNSTLVSIVATGMGTAMMDFLVRESRAVVKGLMAIVRLGSCGGLTSADEVGGCWSPYTICAAVARQRGLMCASSGEPDTHNAGLLLLRAAADGVLGLCFAPPRASHV